MFINCLITASFHQFAKPVMKTRPNPFLLFLILVISCKSNVEYSESEIELRVGDYYSEAQAIQKLDEFSKNIHSADDWKARSKTIRDHIYKGARLDKIPKENWEYPIKVTRGAKYEMDGYSVENISLEMYPGYFVNGNLYLPSSIKGKIPAILCPHGHWFEPGNYGRFRPDVQFRSASFAKMGAVVFVWDMYGTGEDVQHVHLSTDALTYQNYNGIRIIDFISSLDYVDANRIGITGASGGGTQTFLISALDDRISVSVPTVMVSAHFYGGCVCESGLPIHKSGNFETNNVEIAATIAPKPLMIIGDGDDWTKNIPIVEYPYIKSIYKLFNAEENVEYAYFENEVHDYGFSKRKAAYGFMAKHLGLNLDEIINQENEIDEGFVTLLDTTELKMYPEGFLVADPMQH